MDTVGAAASAASASGSASLQPQLPKLSQQHISEILNSRDQQLAANTNGFSQWEYTYHRHKSQHNRAASFCLLAQIECESWTAMKLNASRFLQTPCKISQTDPGCTVSVQDAY